MAIILEHNEQVYKVYFRYDKPAMSCIISVKAGDLWIKVANATIKCYYKDQFIKEEGRKKALDKALRGTFLYRDTRAEFWKAYFGRLDHAN